MTTEQDKLRIKQRGMPTYTIRVEGTQDQTHSDFVDAIKLLFELSSGGLVHGLIIDRNKTEVFDTTFRSDYQLLQQIEVIGPNNVVRDSQ